MNVQSINSGIAANQAVTSMSPGADAISRARSENKRDPSKASNQEPEKNQVQPEELLQNIKALTDNGTYSVRFEIYKETDELVINLIDQKTGDVVRQIPPEEILGLHKMLKELSGNLVATRS